MPAPKPQLTCLAARKQLLLIESEVHRTQLRHDWEDFQAAARAVTAPARQVVSIVRSVASFFRSWPGARPSASNGERKKSAWLDPLLEGARLGASIWSAFRSREG